MENRTESTRIVRFGDFALDLRTGELRTNGHHTILPEKPFQILSALLERPGEMVTREELIKRLWPAGTFVDFNLGLNKAVNRLRDALDDTAEQPRFIETFPKRGYRLIAMPEFETSTEDGSTASQRVTTPLPERHSRFLAAITLSLVCLLAAWLWIRHHDAKRPEPAFQRLSFGRGMILTARFTPDGQSLVYSAAWDGKPSQLFWSRAGSFEARPLGVEADILAISPSGEMAVSMNQRLGSFNRPGVLALMSLTGGAPRKLLDNVQSADWSPDGSKLVVTHNTAGGCALEYPPGKVLYQTTGRAWLDHARISPRGDQIAFLEHPLEDDNAGFVAVIDLAGNRKKLSGEFGGIVGLAWDPSGDAIWFSGREVTPTGPQALFKVTTEGQQFLVRRESGIMSLHDVSRDGHMLVTRNSLRGEVFGRIYPDNKERELGWLDNSEAPDLSPDGATILLSVQEEASGSGYDVFLRKTDGSAAVRLGEGLPLQLSRDGNWALTSYPSGIKPTLPPQLLLLPTGAGQPVTLTHDSIYHGSAMLLPDGKRFLFEGSEPGRERRTWVQDLIGGKPLPITPEGTAGHWVSPDGKLLAAFDPQRKFWLYPMDGGQPTALSGIEPGESVVRWSADGKYLFATNEGVIPVEVYRVEVATGHRQLVYTLSPSDAAGLWGMYSVLVTPDGKSYIYSDVRILSDLYLATGLR
ncbi:MAG: winged helix-turn-helix domain-containing protein [Terriglobales bacterium]|jgi:DNA-binding winged helix-turn-helix (wHTH) protein/Tol biopolymer transport system component